MVIFKREIRLWRDANVTQRALLIRDDVDSAWLAVEMQHDRIVNGVYPSSDSDGRLPLYRQKIDVDFFFLVLNRLVVIAELTQEVADPRQVMSGAMRTFNHATAGMMLTTANDPATVTSVRNALEHGQNLDRRGGLGFARGEDGWYVSYRDRMFETKHLLGAARELHRAIRSAIDPEAFADFRGQQPMIELRDPSTLTARHRSLGTIRIGQLHDS